MTGRRFLLLGLREGNTPGPLQPVKRRSPRQTPIRFTFYTGFHLENVRISPYLGCNEEGSLMIFRNVPMRAVLALPCLLAALSVSGCAVAVLGTAGAVGLTSVQEKTMGEALDDATASNEIKAKLLNESGAKFAEVDVEVANGLVLLSGRVNTPEDRTYAEGIAWSSSRTRDVANEIRIEPPGGFMANVSDEIITGRVRARLIGSSTVKSVNFNVETYDGIVYLMGIARSTEEIGR